QPADDPRQPGADLLGHVLRAAILAGGRVAAVGGDGDFHRDLRRPGSVLVTDRLGALRGEARGICDTLRSHQPVEPQAGIRSRLDDHTRAENVLVEAALSQPVAPVSHIPLQPVLIDEGIPIGEGLQHHRIAVRTPPRDAQHPEGLIQRTSVLSQLRASQQTRDPGSALRRVAGGAGAIQRLAGLLLAPLHPTHGHPPENRTPLAPCSHRQHHQHQRRPDADHRKQQLLRRQEHHSQQEERHHRQARSRRSPQNARAARSGEIAEHRRHRAGLFAHAVPSSPSSTASLARAPPAVIPRARSAASDRRCPVPPPDLSAACSLPPDPPDPEPEPEAALPDRVSLTEIDDSIEPPSPPEDPPPAADPLDEDSPDPPEDPPLEPELPLPLAVDPEPLELAAPLPEPPELIPLAADAAPVLPEAPAAAPAPPVPARTAAPAAAPAAAPTAAPPENAAAPVAAAGTKNLINAGSASAAMAMMPAPIS